MKTDLFQSCGHCWLFQICWHIECSTFRASSFRIWNSWTGMPSPPLALFVVMLPQAHLTSHTRMSGSRWVITPSWLSGSWRSFLYSSYSVGKGQSLLFSNWNMVDLIWGFLRGSDGNEYACSAGDPDSVPGSGRSPGEGNGYPLQYSCLKNSMGRETWEATVRGAAKSQTRMSIWYTQRPHLWILSHPKVIITYDFLRLQQVNFRKSQTCSS